MTVAVARLVQVDWEWELATSLFQPDSQGSVPAATLTLARLMSPALCSMPGWVQVEGAASAVVAMLVARAPPPRARAAPRPPAVLSRPRRLNSVCGRCWWGEVRLMRCISVPWGESDGSDAHLVELGGDEGQRTAGAGHQADVEGGVAEAGDLAGGEVGPGGAVVGGHGRGEGGPGALQPQQCGESDGSAAGEGGGAGDGLAQHQLSGGAAGDDHSGRLVERRQRLRHQQPHAVGGDSGAGDQPGGDQAVTGDVPPYELPCHSLVLDGQVHPLPP